MKRLLGMAILALACASTGEPAVYSVSAEGDLRLPSHFRSLTGIRDGYTVDAILVLRDSVENELILSFTLEPGVPTKYVRGHFKWGSHEGIVTCSSIDFFGGQGGQPSIGGVFRFTTADGRAFKIILPSTEIDRPRRPKS